MNNQEQANRSLLSLREATREAVDGLTLAESPPVELSMGGMISKLRVFAKTIRRNEKRDRCLAFMDQLEYLEGGYFLDYADILEKYPDCFNKSPKLCEAIALEAPLGEVDGKLVVLSDPTYEERCHSLENYIQAVEKGMEGILEMAHRNGIPLIKGPWQYANEDGAIALGGHQISPYTGKTLAETARLKDLARAGGVIKASQERSRVRGEPAAKLPLELMSGLVKKASEQGQRRVARLTSNGNGNEYHEPEEMPGPGLDSTRKPQSRPHGRK
jgi:hypothetical protein